jgi:L-asparagine transporter-like permease
LLPAFIYGFYGFAGIEIMGLLAIRLKNMNDAPKSGKVMLTVLAIIYITSVGLALLMVSSNNFTTEQSPFVTALNAFNIPYVNHFFNAVFIIAGFSTMVASLFAVIRILITLAEDKDAPSLFAKKVGKKIALPAIGLTTAGMVVSILLAIVIPGRLYEYVTTAAGIMLLYNWLFILGSYGRLLELDMMDKVKRIMGFVLVLLGVVGTLFHQTSRPGFYISLLFVVIVAIITFIMQHFWKKAKGDQPPDNPSLFTKLK